MYLVVQDRQLNTGVIVLVCTTGWRQRLDRCTGRGEGRSTCISIQMVTGRLAVLLEVMVLECTQQI